MGHKLTQLRLGQKDSQQHETGLQRKNFKELNNLIGLTMLEDLANDSSLEFRRIRVQRKA